MNIETYPEQNDTYSNKVRKIIGLDLVFAFLLYLFSVSINRFLGLVGDPENPETMSNFHLPLLVSTFSLIYFALIDGFLILEKRIDRRILIFSGVLIFAVLIAESIVISNWILFFYKMFWKTTSELEADRFNGLERMRSEVQQILSMSFLILMILKTIVRIIWNSLWIKAILNVEKRSHSSLN
ncbi:hypothetical protein JWG45_09640 [Leptospira sp. 201903070]|uniref:Uncharacterized protein n=1 Tax=Leptospira ainlahdjerensis TaxID=2810033 RepID=A0ABS2UEU8_9LEPT|nr:hypothetical protein [Leptospira ainlahdjerensis]MBM9577415.1 hypothetical protein [Leptospira ainlahdjerensis]